MVVVRKPVLVTWILLLQAFDFVKGNDRRYYIGVPGIYHEKEKKQAAMYGFCEFLTIGEFEKTTGAFGYWVRRLVEA